MDTLISRLTLDNLAVLSTSLFELYCIMSALRFCQMRKAGAWVQINTINEAYEEASNTVLITVSIQIYHSRLGLQD
jgi:hypothetical protein